MITADISIFAALERLAAACPWDRVDIWVERAPKGEILYHAIVHDNQQFGFPFLAGTSEKDPEEAVDALLRRVEDRDPENARNAKIAELKSLIQKLNAVTVGQPPYVPNRELAQFAKRTVDV